jgi:hypothetical protein
MTTASWPEDLKGKTVWRDTGNSLTGWVTISFSRSVRSAFRFLYGPKLLSNENGLSYFVNGTRFDVTIRVSYNYSSKNNSCCRQITGERGLGKTQISSRSREFSLLQLTAVHIKHGDDVPTESEVRDVVYVKYVLCVCVCVCVCVRARSTSWRGRSTEEELQHNVRGRTCIAEVNVYLAVMHGRVGLTISLFSPQRTQCAGVHTFTWWNCVQCHKFRMLGCSLL